MTIRIERARLPDVMSIAQTAICLGMNEQQVASLINNQEIPAVQIGDQWCVVRRTLMRWMTMKSKEHVNHVGPLR